MSGLGKLTDQAARRTYSGIWAILRDWFKVPEHPPLLPVPPGGQLEALRPSDGWLRYITFQFWLFLIILDGALIVAWLMLLIAIPLAGVLLAVPVLLLAVVPDIFAYIAIHLRYDSTWYVLSDRSMRIRRGIWIINEVTITFENIQNVSVRQGPVQRYFGIADVIVQSAGGGAAAGPHGGGMASGHTGILEGVVNADAIREMILRHVKVSRTAGLGDEHRDHHAPSGPAWDERHVAALRSIRDELRTLGTTRTG